MFKNEQTSEVMNKVYVHFFFNRFRHGYGKKNPRKMVQTWAEKEMSNLFKLFNEGLPVPRPVQLKSHVLVMEFLGTNSLPSPRLKVIAYPLFLCEFSICLVFVSWESKSWTLGFPKFSCGYYLLCGCSILCLYAMYFLLYLI